MIPLNQSYVMHRLTRTRSGAGWTKSFATEGARACRINQPSARDIEYGQRKEEQVTAILYTDPDDTFHYGDEVVCRLERFKVLGSVMPSVPIYRKVFLVSV